MNAFTVEVIKWQTKVSKSAGGSEAEADTGDGERLGGGEWER